LIEDYKKYISSKEDAWEKPTTSKNDIAPIEIKKIKKKIEPATY
jgi:hypothetical protein